MNGQKILLIDDESDVLEMYSELLLSYGYNVVSATNAKQAWKIFQEDVYPVVVTDLKMPPGDDGLYILKKIKSLHPSTEVIIISGHGTNDDKLNAWDFDALKYIEKGSSTTFPRLIDAIKKAFIFVEASHRPYSDSLNDSFFSISCKPSQHLNIRFNGNNSFSATSEKILELETDILAQYASNARDLGDKWRFQCKNTGSQLYQKIFNDHLEVFSQYHRTMEATKSEDEVHFRFEADRDFLRIPIEFLFEKTEYLVLRYPLSRFVTGLHNKRKPLSSSLLNELYARNEELKILLIASNTLPAIPGVDEEIKNLQSSIKGAFEAKGLSVCVKTIPTSDATYSRVQNELKDCKYHVMHYAGHGYYENSSPERSSLFFWEKANKQGSVKQMPVSQLQILLRNSAVRFMYLSCCLGTTTGEPFKLIDDDFLGIADGLILAGVPAVLGFRYPVSDKGAITLARKFYMSLAEHGQLDTALLHARCEVAMMDRDDMTWISPILIVQQLVN